jgi:uncharacterized protein YegP (UPF0339 family)
MELNMRLQRYVDVVGEWRWRIYAANGRIMADSGEGYRNKGDCDHAILTIINWIKGL